MTSAAGRGGLILGQVLALRDDFHAEGHADLSHYRADIARSQQPQTTSIKIAVDGRF
jgi:hypothetical protein